MHLESTGSNEFRRQYQASRQAVLMEDIWRDSDLPEGIAALRRIIKDPTKRSGPDPFHSFFRDANHYEMK